MTDLMAGWPEELQALAEVALVGDWEIKQEASSPFAQPRQVVGGEKPTVEQLVNNAEGPLKITLTVETAPLAVVHGLCALMWARPKDAPLHVDLTKCQVGADGLLALARGLIQIDQIPAYMRCNQFYAVLLQ